MNTLLPFPSFNSIGLLSNNDLILQINHAQELIHLLEDCPSGWYKNEAAMQWYGFLETLKAYYNQCVTLWVQRGFTTDRKIITGLDLRYSTKLPPWIGDERVHGFHRAFLIARNPSFYSRYNWPRTPVRPFYPNTHKRDDHGKLIYVKEAPKPFDAKKFLDQFAVKLI
jgi:hypothetical protein